MDIRKVSMHSLIIAHLPKKNLVTEPGECHGMKLLSHHMKLSLLSSNDHVTSAKFNVHKILMKLH